MLVQAVKGNPTRALLWTRGVRPVGVHFDKFEKIMKCLDVIGSKKSTPTCTCSQDFEIPLRCRWWNSL